MIASRLTTALTDQLELGRRSEVTTLLDAW